MRSPIHLTVLAFLLVSACSCISRTGPLCESNDKGCCPEGEVDDSDGDCCKEEDMLDGEDCPSDSFSAMTAAEQAEAWAKWFAAR